MRSDNAGSRGILIRRTPAEKDREVRLLRSAYRGGYRWVVLMISRGGYLIRSSFFKSYFQAARLHPDIQASGVTILIITISHIVKLMAGTVRSKLSASEINAIRVFMLSQFGLCIADRTVLCQCFLLKEFFPISWKARIRLCDVMEGFSLQLDDGVGEVREPFREFPTAAEVVIELSQLIVSSGWLKKGAKGFTIYGVLNARAANIMGDGGRISLYKGRISAEGSIEMASVVELVDPFGIVNLELTLIARYAGKKGEITFYDDCLRKARLSYRDALPGTSYWNMHPIIISN